LAERNPAAFYPAAPAARAHARAIASEMHAGFLELRKAMWMNVRRRFPGKRRTEGALEIAGQRDKGLGRVLKTLTPEQWRPKTAAAFGYISWAQDRPATTKVLSRKAKPQVGDLVVFDFSHIGIVVKVGEKNFQCVEGNTNGRGTRDSTSGDGVWLKTRTHSLVRNYIRINPSTKV
jgi:hypothetical protein